MEQNKQSELEILCDNKPMKATRFISYGYDSQYFAVVGHDLYRRNKDGEKPYTLFVKGGFGYEPICKEM